MPLKDPAARAAYNREYQKRWYEANKDKRKAQVRQYKRANPAKVAAYDAEYRAKPENKANATRRKQEWREANRDRDRLTRRLWSKAHREQVRYYNSKRDRTEYNRAYYDANRDVYREHNARRYFRVTYGGYEMTESNWSSVARAGK